MDRAVFLQNKSNGRIPDFCFCVPQLGSELVMI